MKKKFYLRDTHANQNNIDMFACVFFTRYALMVNAKKKIYRSDGVSVP